MLTVVSKCLCYPANHGVPRGGEYTDDVTGRHVGSSTGPISDREI